MIIESPHHRCAIAIIVTAGKRVTVYGVNAITRKACPELFPPYGFDPLGALPGGDFYAPPPGGTQRTWERFSSQTTTLMIPRVLTDLIREGFPTCRWDLAGLRLYAIVDRRVVAIIGDGALGGW